MSRDDFDLGDFGDLEGGELPETDEAFLPPESNPTPPRQPRNTTFLVVAVILVILFIIGLAGIALIVVQIQKNNSDYTQTVIAIQKTNDFVNTAVAATATAKSWTATPSPTPIPTDTFTPTPTNTPTNTPMPPTVTPSPTIDTAALTATAAALAGVPSDAQTQTMQAIQSANMTATCTIDPSSPGCGGNPTLTPTEVGPVGTESTLTGDELTQTAAAFHETETAQAVLFGTATRTLPPKPSATATCTVNQKLPCGGIFDDLAGGNASPSNLAVVGLAVIALVGVIFASRRLRVRA